MSDKNSTINFIDNDSISDTVISIIAQKNIQSSKKYNYDKIDGKIQVFYDKNNYIFYFYDNNNSLLGYFSVQDIVDYLASCWIRIDDNDSIQLIKKLIFNVEFNNSNKSYNIIFKPYTQSPFTGNIEVLIKLLNGINKYKINEFGLFINSIESKSSKEKITNIFEQFIFLLLNHIANIINILLEKTDKDESYTSLKYQLLNYNQYINSKINDFIRTEIDKQINRNDKIYQSIMKISKIKNKLLSKINYLDIKINKQNRQLDNIITKLEEKEQSYLKIPILSTSSYKNITQSVHDNIEQKIKDINIETLLDDDNKYESDDNIDNIDDSIIHLETSDCIENIHKI